MDISSAVGVAGGIVVGVLASANCLAPAPAAPAAPPSVAAEYSYSCDAFDGAPPADTRDAKVVHFIRHAQGQHNLAVATEGEQAYTNWTWRDSRLTPTGIEQSAAAAPVTDKMKFDVVLCSPLSRTLQTAVQAVPSMHGKIVADELCRERVGLNPCDLRREKNVLVKEFPEVSFEHLSGETDADWSVNRETLSALQDRCDEWLAGLFDGPASKDKCYIGCVTHNDFLTMLLYDSSLQYNSSLPADRKFANCAIRSYIISRRQLRPFLDEASLTPQQVGRYPKSTGSKPVVQ